MPGTCQRATTSRPVTSSEAAIAIVEWLFEQDEVEVVTAHIYPGHAASERVAINAGLTVTDDLVDGERVWRRYKREPELTHEVSRP